MPDPGKRYLRQSGPPIKRGDEWVKPKAAIILCDEPGCTAYGSFRRGWLSGHVGEAWCRTHLPGDYWLTSEVHHAPVETPEAPNANRPDATGNLFE